MLFMLNFYKVELLAKFLGQDFQKVPRSYLDLEYPQDVAILPGKSVGSQSSLVGSRFYIYANGHPMLGQLINNPFNALKEGHLNGFALSRSAFIQKAIDFIEFYKNNPTFCQGYDEDCGKFVWNQVLDEVIHEEIMGIWTPRHHYFNSRLNISHAINIIQVNLCILTY